MNKKIKLLILSVGFGLSASAVAGPCDIPSPWCFEPDPYCSQLLESCKDGVQSACHEWLNGRCSL
jgi:hypothetical protein